MIEINFDQFKDITKNFIPNTIKELEIEGFDGGIKELQEYFDSGKATAFTKKANKMFREKNLTDDEGNPITVENPGPALSDLTIDKTEIRIELSAAQERWFRANQLYGNDILGKLGFKYTK